MLNNYPFTHRDRALEIWCKEGVWKVGSYDRHKEEWKWYEGHAKEAGVKTPSTTQHDEGNKEGDNQQPAPQHRPNEDPAPAQEPDVDMAQPTAPAS